MNGWTLDDVRALSLDDYDGIVDEMKRIHKAQQT